jgi:hypothetical protein
MFFVAGEAKKKFTEGINIKKQIMFSERQAVNIEQNGSTS